MKKFFNLTTIIVTAVLVAGAVFFLWAGSYATAVMTLVALYWAYMARRSELMAADNFEIIGDVVSHRDSLQAERDKLLAENKALGERVARLLEESAKVPGNAVEKEPVDSPEPQPAKSQSRKRPRSKRPIQDIKESLKEISPKKEAE